MPVGAVLNTSVTVAVVLPPLLLAVTVYATVPVCAAVKVPEITPVVGLMLKPAGSAGEIV